MISRAEFKPLETAYRNYEANATVKNAADFLDEAGKVQAKAVGGGYSIESPYSRVNAAMEADFAVRQGANGEILPIEASDSITVRPDIDGGELVGDNEGDRQAIGGTTVAYDFKGIKNLDDFRSRIPSDARELPWRNIDGGASEGVKYRWTDEFGNVWNVRAHSIDPNAPLGSNASQGWIYRVEVRWSGVGKRYFMDSFGLFHQENVLNPNSPLYNEAIANDTHIVLGEIRKKVLE